MTGPATQGCAKRDGDQGRLVSRDDHRRGEEICWNLKKRLETRGKPDGYSVSIRDETELD